MRRVRLKSPSVLGLSFPYNETLIRQIKGLPDRRWNPQSKEWEVHISHLEKVVNILRVPKTLIPKEIWEEFNSKWSEDIVTLTVGNCLTSISGGDIPLDKLDLVTAFPVPGAEHSQKFKEGKWDGYKHLLKKDGAYTIPTGLLGRITSVLRNTQKKIKFVNEKFKSEPSLKLEVSSDYTPREYQIKTIEAALEKEVGVMQLATGSGKTIIAGHIWKELGRPGIFFVHTKDLLYQAKDFFSKMFNIPIGQIGDGVLDIQPVTVATIQTTARAFGIKVKKEEDSGEVELKDSIVKITEAVENAEVAFFDECHHVPAETCYSIALNLPKAFFRFGLSATPYRTDRHDMMIEAALGSTFYEINSSDLVDLGFLVYPEIHFFNSPPVVFPPGYQSYQKVYKKAIVENDDRNKLIADQAKKYSNDNKTVLILVQQIQHGKRIHKLLDDSVFLTGKDSSNIRNLALENFKKRQIPILIATTLADEGLDIPNLEVLILAGAGQSETRALQRIGRALRPFEGKEKAIVIDFIDSSPFLEEHSQKRMVIYNTEDRFKIIRNKITLT